MNRRWGTAGAGAASWGRLGGGSGAGAGGAATRIAVSSTVGWEVCTVGGDVTLVEPVLSFDAAMAAEACFERSSSSTTSTTTTVMLSPPPAARAWRTRSWAASWGSASWRSVEAMRSSDSSLVSPSLHSRMRSPVKGMISQESTSMVGSMPRARVMIERWGWTWASAGVSLPSRTSSSTKLWSSVSWISSPCWSM